MQLIKKNHASNKLAALVMILAMLVMSVSFVAPVQAGPGHIIEVSSGTGSPDQEVSLNITVAEKQGLAGVQYKVHYDKNQFSINTADLDGDGNGDGLVFNSTEPYFGWNQSTIYNDDGYVAIASASAAAFETSGSIDLVTIKFTVKPDAINGTYQITISEAKGTDGSPDPAFPLETSVNGFITITNGAPANIASVVDVTANVANGTSLADAKAALGTTVEVTLEGGGTATVPITWSEDSTPAYNATTAGDYVFTGTFGELPAGVANGNNVTAPTGTVTVAAPGLVNIASVAPVTANVANGTSLADAKAALGTTVEVTLEGGGTATVPITWSEDSTPAYNATTAGDYVFTGTFGELPAGVANGNNVTAPTGTVTVAAPGLVNIASVAPVTANVANGTSLADAKAALGTTVEVTLEGGGTATVPITWSEDSAPSYDANTEGVYVFTGNFGTLPNGVTNNNNVAAPSGTVTVSGLAVVYGDVNKDSVVDSWDALDILLYDSQLFNDVSAAATDIFANNPAIADINGDNSIDSWDALDLLLYDSQLYDEISDAAKTKLGL